MSRASLPRSVGYCWTCADYGVQCHNVMQKLEIMAVDTLRLA